MIFYYAIIYYAILFILKHQYDPSDVVQLEDVYAVSLISLASDSKPSQ